MTDATAAPAPGRRRITTLAFTIGALVVALVIAVLVSLAASSNPDGLEYVAGATGFEGTASDSAAAGSPLADYAVAGIDNPILSNLVVGLVGCGAVFLIGLGIGAIARRRSTT